MDYVVSSYTPTVTSLTQRVSNSDSIGQDVSGIFLVSQPKVPHADPIPGTTEEVSSLHQRAKDNGIRSEMVDGEGASAHTCPDIMEKFSSIHLACHASQNASNPLQSRFLFHDGHLTLTTIMQKNLENADLAFLSACETGTGEETLADEAVHLAAGMLAAGYRRVVATMWSISDRHAPTVANDFYEYLWARRSKDAGTKFDGALSAYALHHAIRNLRENLDNTEHSLLTWIPYVHFGY
jgi:CHAT domain-containing protein